MHASQGDRFSDHASHAWPVVRRPATLSERQLNAVTRAPTEREKHTRKAAHGSTHRAPTQKDGLEEADASYVLHVRGRLAGGTLRGQGLKLRQNLLDIAYVAVEQERACRRKAGNIEREGSEHPENALARLGDTHIQQGAFFENRKGCGSTTVPAQKVGFRLVSNRSATREILPSPRTIWELR